MTFKLPRYDVFNIAQGWRVWDRKERKHVEDFTYSQRDRAQALADRLNREDEADND